MLFGGTLPPETIPYTTVFRQHIYQTADGKVVWPSVNGPIPERWPSLPAGVAGFYTLYPDPDELLAGKLDGRLQAFLAGAQPGSMLTTFAEADTDASAGGQFAPLGLTAAKLRDVHARMQALCANAHVRYGSVTCGYSASSLGWSARGLDFYGLDIYEPCPPGIMNALAKKCQRLPAGPVAVHRRDQHQHPRPAPVLVLRHLRLAESLRPNRRRGARHVHVLEPRRPVVRPLATRRPGHHRSSVLDRAGSPVMSPAGSWQPPASPPPGATRRPGTHNPPVMWHLPATNPARRSRADRRIVAHCR